MGEDVSAYNPVTPEISLEGYSPIVILGPEGSPNGSLVADPQAVVITTSGEVYVKSVGSDEYGWIQTN